MVKTTTGDKSSISLYNQLIILGVLAVTIAFLPQFFGMVFWDYPFMNSISHSANSYGTSPILPFILGSMAVFFFAYQGYDRTDRILAKLMAVGALGVAMFQCKGGPMQGDLASILALSKDTANLVHSLTALVLFVSYIIWVRFQFTKGILDQKQTEGKKKRNKVYKYCGNAAFFGTLAYGVLTLIPGVLKGFDANIWVIEVIILLPLGFATLVKGGCFLKDK